MARTLYKTFGCMPTYLLTLALQALGQPGKTWRDVRVSLNTPGALSQGFNETPQGYRVVRKPIWTTFDGPQFRDERWADDVAPRLINHNGWYSDADCSETVRGIVSRLPHGRFIAGYYWSMNGERVYLPEVHDDERDAAIAADSAAQHVGEREKEYNERWHAAHELSYEIAETGRKVARMFKLRHADGFDSAADYRELEEGIEELRRLKAKLANDYSDIEVSA